jgi:hypothetical protein
MAYVGFEGNAVSEKPDIASLTQRPFINDTGRRNAKMAEKALRNQTQNTEFE